jgi:hypothetical protein
MLEAWKKSRLAETTKDISQGAVCCIAEEINAIGAAKESRTLSWNIIR